jgi:ERCC4-related helicase
MLKGFAEAHKATGNNRYADISLKNAQLIIQKI